MPLYRLRLYILGTSNKSRAAEENLRRICEHELAGNYELEVIDVLERPEQAEQDRVLATPMLIKLEPAPQQRLVGDMSLTEKVYLGLGLGPTTWLTRNKR
jgi:circadian clock protein KaiB